MGGRGRDTRARVGGVNAYASKRADHAFYIAAIRRAVESRDVRVAEVQVSTSPDGRREAVLTLHPDSEAFAERVPEVASASWDEDNGWSILVRDASLVSRVHEGLNVLPTPDDVAAWVVVVLAHPELTPSYEDQPFRVHEATDAEFEGQLARYVAWA